MLRRLSAPECHLEAIDVSPPEIGVRDIVASRQLSHEAAGRVIAHLHPAATVRLRRLAVPLRDDLVALLRRCSNLTHLSTSFMYQHNLLIQSFGEGVMPKLQHLSLSYEGQQVFSDDILAKILTALADRYELLGAEFAHLTLHLRNCWLVPALRSQRKKTLDEAVAGLLPVPSSLISLKIDPSEVAYSLHLQSDQDEFFTFFYPDPVSSQAKRCLFSLFLTNGRDHADLIEWLRARAEAFVPSKSIALRLMGVLSFAPGDSATRFEPWLELLRASFEADFKKSIRKTKALAPGKLHSILTQLAATKSGWISTVSATVREPLWFLLSYHCHTEDSYSQEAMIALFMMGFVSPFPKWAAAEGEHGAPADLLDELLHPSGIASPARVVFLEWILRHILSRGSHDQKCSAQARVLAALLAPADSIHCELVTDWVVVRTIVAAAEIELTRSQLTKLRKTILHHLSLLPERLKTKGSWETFRKMAEKLFVDSEAPKEELPVTESAAIEYLGLNTEAIPHVIAAARAAAWGMQGGGCFLS